MRSILILLIVLASVSTSLSQHAYPSLSPEGTLQQVVGDTEVSIRYERPMVRGRTIFGELVPYGKVWRTGAGNSTIIRFDKDVVVSDQQVSAGAYSLFSIPKTEEWIIILNRDTTLYGSYFYDSSKDEVRFSAKAGITDRHYESLTIDIDLVGNNANVFISWDNVQVQFPIETEIDSKTMNHISQVLKTKKTKDPDDYGMAADYLLMNNRNLKDALLLADLMIENKGNIGWAYNVQLSAYEKLGHFEKALEVGEKHLALIRSNSYEKEQYRQDEVLMVETAMDRVRKKMAVR